MHTEQTLAKTMNTITDMMRARFPLIVIETSEESRAIQGVLSEVRTKAHLRDALVYQWDQAAALRRWAMGPTSWALVAVSKEELNGTLTTEQARTAPDGAAVLTIADLCQIVQEQPYNAAAPQMGIYLALDVHELLAKTTTEASRDRRALRNLVWHLMLMKRSVIFITHAWPHIPELAQDIAIVRMPLPSREEFTDLVTAKANMPSIADRVPIVLGNGAQDRIVDSMRGMTMSAADNALILGVVTNQQLGPKVIPGILAHKEQAVRASKLEYIHARASDADVGGLENLKAYVRVVRRSFSPEARAAGVPRPRGLLMVGLPGTGKSLTAEIIAGGTMPILRMDLGAMMGSLYGQSEGNLSQALKVIEAVAPCVVWIDEMEKMVGSGGSGVPGREVEGRMMASLLTWMQETTAPVYVVGTANEVGSLNDALISRFDDVFWIDVPDDVERAAIIAIHCAAQGIVDTSIDMAALVVAMDGYSGREIAKVAKKAALLAWSDDVPLSTATLLHAVRLVVPITRMHAQRCEEIRQWGERWATPASQARVAIPRRRNGRAHANDTDPVTVAPDF